MSWFTLHETRQISVVLSLCLMTTACVSAAQTRSQLIEAYHAESAALKKDDWAPGMRAFDRSEIDREQAIEKFGPTFAAPELESARLGAQDALAAVNYRAVLAKVRRALPTTPMNYSPYYQLERELYTKEREAALRSDPLLKQAFDALLEQIHPVVQQLGLEEEIGKLLVGGSVGTDKALELIFGPPLPPGHVPWTLRCSHACNLKLLIFIQDRLNGCASLSQAPISGLRLDASPESDKFRADMLATAKERCANDVRAGVWKGGNAAALIQSLRESAEKASPQMKQQVNLAIDTVEELFKQQNGGKVWSPDQAPEYIAAQKKLADTRAQFDALIKAGKYAEARDFGYKAGSSALMREVDRDHPTAIVAKLRQRMKAIEKSMPLTAAVLQMLSTSYGDMNPTVSESAQKAAWQKGMPGQPVLSKEFVVDTHLGYFQCPELEDEKWQMLRYGSGAPGWALLGANCQRDVRTVNYTDQQRETRQVMRQVPSADGLSSRSVYVDQYVYTTQEKSYQVENEDSRVVTLRLKVLGKPWPPMTVSVVDDKHQPMGMILRELYAKANKQYGYHTEAEQLAAASAHLGEVFKALAAAKTDDSRDELMAEIAILTRRADPGTVAYFVKRYGLTEPVNWTVPRP
jgi:hypothetical protein